MKINQKVWHIEINNSVIEKSYKPNGVVIKELKIIGISEYKICLNNDWFTALDIIRSGGKKEKHCSYIDNISTSIRTQNSILGDGIFISLFSTKKPSQKLLEKMVGSASNTIEKEYGFLLRGAKDELYELIKSK